MRIGHGGGGGGGVDVGFTTATGRTALLGKQLYLTRQFNEGNADHGALVSLSNGVDLTAHDGGIQSFQQSTFDCTAASRQALALYGGCTATRSAGVNNLTNYGALLTASGGQQNFGVFVAAGLARFDGTQMLFTAGWGTSMLLDDFLTVGGTTTLNGPLVLTKAFKPDITTFTAAAGVNNDVALAAGTTMLRVDTAAGAASISSIVADSKRVIFIVNIGANNLTLTNAAATGTAANRLLTGGADVVLGADDACILQYDVSSSRWRALGRNQ